MFSIVMYICIYRVFADFILHYCYIYDPMENFAGNRSLLLNWKTCFPSVSTFTVNLVLANSVSAETAIQQTDDDYKWA